MPSTFILDGAGVVRFVHAGYHPGDESILELEVGSLLGKAADAAEKNRLAARPSDPAPGAQDEPTAAGTTVAPSDAKTTAVKAHAKSRKNPSKAQPAS
jgi:hypothetical protein